jgi:hypothetical protein
MIMRILKLLFRKNSILAESTFNMSKNKVSMNAIREANSRMNYQRAIHSRRSQGEVTVKARSVAWSKTFTFSKTDITRAFKKALETSE